jgi:PAS domain S-box-containing protein
MPDMNGLELLGHLKKKQINIPFIIVTGKGREEIIIDALNKGVEFYLQKSTEMESMFQELNNYISKSLENLRIKNEFTELKELYETLINLSPEGILIHVNQIIQYINPSLVRTLGYNTEEDLLGQSVFQIIHPDSFEFLKKRMNIVLTGAITPFVKVKLMKKGGNPLNIEGTGRTIHYKGNNAIIVYIRDMDNYAVS